MEVTWKEGSSTDESEEDSDFIEPVVVTRQPTPKREIFKPASGAVALSVLLYGAWCNSQLVLLSIGGLFFLVAATFLGLYWKMNSVIKGHSKSVESLKQEYSHVTVSKVSETAHRLQTLCRDALRGIKRMECARRGLFAGQRLPPVTRLEGNEWSALGSAEERKQFVFHCEAARSALLRSVFAVLDGLLVAVGENKRPPPPDRSALLLVSLSGYLEDVCCLWEAWTASLPAMVLTCTFPLVWARLCAAVGAHTAHTSSVCEYFRLECSSRSALSLKTIFAQVLPLLTSVLRSLSPKACVEDPMPRQVLPKHLQSFSRVAALLAGSLDTTSHRLLGLLIEIGKQQQQLSLAADFDDIRSEWISLQCHLEELWTAGERALRAPTREPLKEALQERNSSAALLEEEDPSEIDSEPDRPLETPMMEILSGADPEEEEEEGEKEEKEGAESAVVVRQPPPASLFADLKLALAGAPPLEERHRQVVLETEGRSDDLETETGSVKRMLVRELQSRMEKVFSEPQEG